MGTNNLSLLGLRVIVEWSIEHSCMSHAMRERATKDFAEAWIEFCQWIINTHDKQELKE